MRQRLFQLNVLGDIKKESPFVEGLFAYTICVSTTLLHQNCR